MPDKSVIHGWAATAAVTAAVLPAGADVAALIAEEATVVVRVATMFGHDVDEKVVKKALTAGALTSAGIGAVGLAGAIAAEAVTADTVFEGLNIGYPFTIPLKSAAAVAAIEAVGHAAYKYYENGGT